MKLRIVRSCHLLLFLLSLSLLVLPSCSSSRRSIGVEAGWDLLGERKVNFVRDKDEITVNSRYTYTTIRFRVENKDISISELKVYFNNGDKLEPAVNEVIRANESSRFIELGQQGRFINRIEFKYRSTGSIL